MKPLRYVTQLALAALLCSGSASAEKAMYGGTPSRNMVSTETGLPSKWDVESGLNVKWSEALGSQAYGGPVIAGGKVFIGTNNEGERDPEIKGDKGVVMAFDVENGAFLWQMVHDKLPIGRVNDWPLQGVCSTPFIDGDRLWYISNRAEIVCADVDGFRDGENDGPYDDEARKGDTNADILWSYDMIGELDVFPHNLAVSSPLVIDGVLFTVTGNGVDEGHINIPTPLAPSFIAIDADKGELLWENADPGENILHGSWSNPAYGVIGGAPQAVFPGGDGVVYSFEPKTGKLLWTFDANPKDSVWELGGAGTRNNLISTPVIWSGKVFIAVGQDPEHGEGIGHLYAIDATKRGDITDTGAIWHLGGADYNRTMSTVAIADDILYTADLSGFLYAIDVKTGKVIWKYDAFAAVWSSPYVADGKVYLSDEDGDIAVLKAGRKKEVLAEINMGAAVYTTPVAHDGVLYVASRSRLFALQEGIPAKATNKPEKAATVPATKPSK